MGDLQKITAAVVEGKAMLTKELVEEALKNHIEPQEILYNGLINGMNVVGERFRNAEFYIPDVLTSSRAVHAGMRVIRASLRQKNGKIPGCIVIGTVAGDLHDIGKNIVIMFLEAHGYEVIDLGIDVHPQEFLDAIAKYKPQVVGMSALLTTTMTNMASTIRLLEETHLRERVKIIVGGAPVTAEFAKSIGADGYAPDAKKTVEIVEQLLAETKK